MKVLNEEEIPTIDSLNADESAKEIYLEHEARRQRFKSNKICLDVEVPEGWKDIKVAKFD